MFGSLRQAVTGADSCDTTLACSDSDGWRNAITDDKSDADQLTLADAAPLSNAIKEASGVSRQLSSHVGVFSIYPWERAG